MPTATYEELLAEAAPVRIESEDRYQVTTRRLGELIRLGKARTSEETKLMRLLAIVVEDYDRRHAMPPDESTPAERLRFLLEHSGKTAAVLLPVFGQRSHASEALNGKRQISTEQARKLASIFGVRPGLFV